MRLWASTSAGVTFRLQLQLQSTCPSELPVINYKKKQCQPQAAALKPLYIGLIAAVLFLTVALLLYVCWLIKVAHRSPPFPPGSHTSILMCKVASV